MREYTVSSLALNHTKAWEAGTAARSQVVNFLGARPAMQQLSQTVHSYFHLDSISMHQGIRIVMKGMLNVLRLTSAPDCLLQRWPTRAASYYQEGKLATKG